MIGQQQGGAQRGQVGRNAPTAIQRGPVRFAPPRGRGMMMPQVTLRLPNNIRTNLSMFQPGSVIHGKVTGKEGGNFMLRLGEHTLQAQSKVPLTVGQSVQFKIQGQQNGKLQLQLLKTPFTKMSTADISQTLTSLKVPGNEGNVALAKVMVEHKIPLTKENFVNLKSVLAQPAQPGPNGQPAPTQARVAATTFLQQSQIATNPGNVSTMANFLNTNPQIGVQMVSLNSEFRRLTKAAKAGGGTATIELMNGVQSALGEFILEPKRRSESKKKPSKKLKNMARQTGIEGNLGSLYRGSDDDWDLLQMMRELRNQLPKDEENVKLFALLKGLEENLEAHKLINQARNENGLGYYYLQVPMRLEDGDLAEIWVKYYEDENGNRFVDLDDTSIEFLVTTQDMGELHFTIDLNGDRANIDMASPSQEVREFTARYLPALADRIARLGWTPGRVSASYRAFQGRRELVEHEDFDTLERCSVQA